ncbi:hypothetical protein M422DRAFT_49486 [Sphaerobolus stellatus SS14]|uniref:T6SS Phospholipase effector Tle1-like catalytic domain-containing protein n=1 Tax=Sphaerobolus stellatus (strain SS14) TaxID=990650 RepID=A0A0C9U9L7_SPHS4|nr:hypothetical protein M422DRAFT_49486 [Sphaerobolus stellatus SS14]
MESPQSGTIPPNHAHRTIVLCFDGTQNKISNQLSNVAKLFSLLERGDPSRQLVYYQTGIETYTSSSLTKGPISSRIAKTLDSMFATSIAGHVQDLAGDRICIFGFSRGAYTARALAAMLQKVGLLQRGNHRHIPYAWEAYTLTSEEGWRRAGDFKKFFGMDVDIEFIGVWDSVGYLGLNRFLLLTTNITPIKTVRQALALDEQSTRFRANVWGVRPSSQGQSSETKMEPATSANARDKGKEENDKQDDENRLLAFEHVGGGNMSTNARHALSKVTLRWMVRQCFLAETGIMFKEHTLREIGLDLDMLYPVVCPRPPPATNVVNIDVVLSEEEEDLLDSRCGIMDELQNKPACWA